MHLLACLIDEQYSFFYQNNFKIDESQAEFFDSYIKAQHWSLRNLAEGI